jgi:hypothetical protein
MRGADCLGDPRENRAQLLLERREAHIGAGALGLAFGHVEALAHLDLQ